MSRGHPSGNPWLMMSLSSIQEVLGLVLCHVLRMVERFLPPWWLQVLFWPAAAVLACWELAYASLTITQFYRLPLSFRPLPRSTWIWRVWLRRTQVNLARLLCLWPDRLGDPRWQKYCRSSGMEQFEDVRARGGPVILATLHFGPLSVLRFWL